MTSSVDYPKAPANASTHIHKAYLDAADGDIGAQLYLGMTSHSPDCIPTSHRMFFLLEAARAGNKMAIRELIAVYLEPEERQELDDDPASDAYEGRKQYGSGINSDPLDLGDKYFTGAPFIEQDMDRAFTFYKIAVADGDPVAMRKLGYMYEHGLGVEKSLDKAAGYYAMAAQDDEEAGWLLRSLVYREDGVRIPDWAFEDA